MTETDLKNRLRSFSIRILRLCDALPNSGCGRAVSNQLVRAGTSPGANYRAACCARSLADFVGKLAIAEEEMDESGYWLDLIIAHGMVPAKRVQPLNRESEELLAILASSRLTAKKRLQSQQPRKPEPNRKPKIENRKLTEAP